MFKDYEEAVKWYRKAAEQNYADAQVNLGVCYMEGQGVGKDYVEAVKWYRKAAEQGNEFAKKKIAELASNETMAEDTEAQRIERDHREAAATDVPAKSVSEMKCPKGWAYFNNMYRQTGAEPYMHCDFTTQTCERGFITHLRGITSRVFELLAKDRQTVIGHYMCPGSGGCMDFDSGLYGEGRSTFAHPIFCDPKT